MVYDLPELVYDLTKLTYDLLELTFNASYINSIRSELTYELIVDV